MLFMLNKGIKILKESKARAVKNKEKNKTCEDCVFSNPLKIIRSVKQEKIISIKHEIITEIGEYLKRINVDLFVMSSTFGKVNLSVIKE